MEMVDPQKPPVQLEPFQPLAQSQILHKNITKNGLFEKWEIPKSLGGQKITCVRDTDAFLAISMQFHAQSKNSLGNQKIIQMLNNSDPFYHTPYFLSNSHPHRSTQRTIDKI